MEAVPRLHMLWFSLKSSPEGTSFANLKKYIAEYYHEDPEAYSKEVFALETLRNQAMHRTKDSCAIMKRYYCQLHSLQNRFPQLAERGILTFNWKDLYQNNISEVTDVRYEMAAVLFNIAASHTQVGASVTRGNIDGMKMACTHFQCAAWAFGELREKYANVNSGTDFMTTELLVFMQQVCYAQAQECILEKSLIDNRKPNIVAKVTAQITVYYGAALAALLTGGNDGPIVQAIDASVYKLWKTYVRFKINYLNCILYLYQGQHSEEQRKMGERVTLYQAAWDKLEEARKESKGLPDQKEIVESLRFTADVVEAKRKNAKNENEFIYHESVPELSTISAVQGANLVNGISFSVFDPEVAGEDIFARLVPMKAHEASSLYSEEKAKLLRKYGAMIEEKDTELTSYMSSLSLDNLNINEEKANKLPQGIVDRCAALNANKTAISDLIAAMSQLAEITADVETNLNELSSMLAAEEQEEREFQAKTGVSRTPNPHITELTREYQKYSEAHARAGESNNTLRKAMAMHVNNLKILARPLQEIQQMMPKLSTELNTAEIFKDVKLIVNKVNEMKAQRAQFHADLRIAVNDDDITAKVIAHGAEEGMQALFDKELAKHERLTQLIEQNLLAQQNILHALTESYAKAAPVLKTLADVKQKRENFYTSLAASYDVYEDLLAKSAKGLEFYKKLAGNVQKLYTRFKAARDVQSEERQQRLGILRNTHVGIVQPTAKLAKSQTPVGSNVSTTPKLRDYLKAKNSNATGAENSNNMHMPFERPVPVGSENPSQAACSSANYYNPNTVQVSTAPNEPPPPYSLQHQQFYEHATGYTNPMFGQQQQHIAPPAYKLQASPNSQFGNLNASMANLALQTNYSGINQQQQYLQQQQPQMQAYGQPTTAVNTNNNSPYGNVNPTPTQSYAAQPFYQLPSQSIQATVATTMPTTNVSQANAYNYQQPSIYSQNATAMPLNYQQNNVPVPATQPLYVATSVAQQEYQQQAVVPISNSSQTPQQPLQQMTSLLQSQSQMNQQPFAPVQKHQLTPIQEQLTPIQQQPPTPIQQIQPQQMYPLRIENTPRIAFVDPVGSCSQLVVQQFSGRRSEKMLDCLCQTFAEALKLVEAGDAKYCILPIENSLSGSIKAVYDLLQNTQLSVVDDIRIQIDHCLLAKCNTSIDRIEIIYSNVETVQQCSAFLVRFPYWRIQYCDSNAAAMQKVSELNLPNVAALGGQHAGALYGLHVLQPSVISPQVNITRFVVLAYDAPGGTPQQKLSIQKALQNQFQQQEIQQPQSVAATTSTISPLTHTISATNHPGYQFNPQTGTYEYSSGYQQAQAGVTQQYGQFTLSGVQDAAVVGTTDSEIANKINLATGFDKPIVSHTKPTSAVAMEAPKAVNDTVPNYYTPPYGYHSLATPGNVYNASAAMPSPQAISQAPQEMSQQQPQLQQQEQNNSNQNSIYMQSGSTSIANTQTTKSNVEYASSPQQTPHATPVARKTIVQEKQAAAAAATVKTPVTKQSSNIDLLSDVDFTGTGDNVPPPILPEPILQPQRVATPETSAVRKNASELDKAALAGGVESITSTTTTVKPQTISANELTTPAISPQIRKLSLDNLSNCSELSALDSIDWDPLTQTHSIDEKHSLPATTITVSSANSTTFQMSAFDPFTDDKTLKYFHKEVERYEKFIESLNVKMLNGNTQLTAKWKELQDLIAKDTTKRTTTIAKLFPEKNRSLDCLPYDHARVKLDKETDDYINAAYLNNLGTGCPNFIITQTPQSNTINDFWSMIWSQRARTVLCLHTAKEMFDPYWPEQLEKQVHYDDFTVQCLKVNTLTHNVQYHLKLTMHGSDDVIDLSVLQIKQWIKASPTQVLGIAHNALEAHKKICHDINEPAAPLILSCLTGSERSELLAIAICAISATQTKPPVLINVVDVWSRICSQRQNSLRDTTSLELSMQIVLNNAHDVLNKRGIMTSYQVKIAPNAASKEQQEIKDPLNELDPLWKLK